MDVRFLFLILAVYGATATSTDKKCSPSCYMAVPNDLVEDPLDCRQYYICLWDGEPNNHAVLCEPGMVFDPQVGDCVDGTTCTSTCEAEGKVREEEQSCKYHCDSKTFVDLVSDPFDSSLYYLCQSGAKYGPFECPEDRSTFNGFHCTQDATVSCRDSCLPYCAPGSVQVNDPMDCSRYYICLDEGLPSEELHFQCIKGKVQDTKQGRCVKDGQCQITCTIEQAEQLMVLGGELDKVAEMTYQHDLRHKLHDVATSLEKQRYEDHFVKKSEK